MTVLSFCIFSDHYEVNILMSENNIIRTTYFIINNRNFSAVGGQ